MRIIYKETKNISPSQMFELYKSVGWIGKKDNLSAGKSIASVYRNSDIVISAWNKKELVGMIRALTDKKITGVVFGLVVKKSYQKQSIGKNLMKKCIGKYPKVRWYLGCKPGLKKFYKKVGFKLDKDPWFKKIK